MRRPLVVALACALGCGGRGAATDRPARPPVTADPHSFARPEVARVTHLSLDLTADFAARVLSGSATLTIERTPGAREIVLDSDGLDVREVTGGDGAPLALTRRPAIAGLGEALVIALPATGDRIVVRYATRPEAAALQWLTPVQTAGRRHPFLFSQGQAILTRSWIPTQDSPGVRQTYDARITVPRELSCVMSAEMLTPAGVEVAGGRRFDFRMPEAIPPYLIAIAIGELAFQPIGPRTGVYSEPSMLAAAAHELADLEAMMAAAERLGGPYRWGRYDVLVLPPSFPFGGMENPRLTFVTPTIIAGDRSLVALIAHELAHSWSGNLVTNATWNDFWLNEGFTTYVESRIMEIAYGPARAAMNARLAHDELVREMATLPPADQHLELDLAGRNPDDGMTQVAYDKGAALLVAIERKVGRARFDAYLRGYFDRHAFRSLTTAGFVADLREHLLAGDRALEASLELDAWLHRPGLPASAVAPPADVFARVDRQAARFLAGEPAAALEVAGWTPQEWQRLLDRLLEVELAVARVAELDAAFRLAESGNSEILFSFLRLAIKRRHEPALPALERFLTGQGRRKFLKPLYQDLMASEWSQPLARRIYAVARPSYHSVAARTLDDIVH